MPRAVPTPRIPESLRADGTLRQVRTEDGSVARSEVQESPEESDDLVDVCHRAERALSQALRRSETDERPQDEPEVERCGMQVVPLHDVGLPTEMRAAHGSTLQGVSERALDELAALSHQCLALVSLESPPVLMGRQFRALLVRPTPFTTVRLADVTARSNRSDCLHHTVRVVTLVRDPFRSDIVPQQPFTLRILKDGRQPSVRCLHRSQHSRGVANSRVLMVAATMAPVFMSTACSVE